MSLLGKYFPLIALSYFTTRRHMTFTLLIPIERFFPFEVPFPLKVVSVISGPHKNDHIHLIIPNDPLLP